MSMLGPHPLFFLITEKEFYTYHRVEMKKLIMDMDLSLVLIFIIIVLFPLHTLGWLVCLGQLFQELPRRALRPSRHLEKGKHRQGYVQEQTSDDIAKKKATNNLVASF